MLKDDLIIFGISVFHNFVAEYMLCLFACSVLGFGMRYLLKLSLLIISELLVVNHFVELSGSMLLSNFHMKI